MIYANIKDAKFYASIDEKIKLCMQKAKDLNADTPCGRYELTDEVYVNVMTYEPKAQDQAVCETHDRYADIQLILSGEEYMGIPEPETLKEVTPYDKEKDIALWNAKIAFVSMKKGDFCLFMPKEAHAPSVRNDVYKEGDKVKKAVFKIKYHD